MISSDVFASLNSNHIAYAYIVTFSCLKAEIFASFVSLYLYVPDEVSLLPKYRDCATSNDFELYLMCCGAMILRLIIYIYVHISFLASRCSCNF